MINLEKIINEALTPSLFKKYSSTKMDFESRINTDSLFGEGNDFLKFPIKTDVKTDTHKQIESKLNSNISHDDYYSNSIKDKYGRNNKLSKLIGDEKLRQKYNDDYTNDIRGIKDGSYVTVHRGTEVAGQTTPKHSWGDTCKNIYNGNNKEYLRDEIRAGTVVVFGHDHTGKEVYRATLQPHHNENQESIYVKNSEYGIKHPEFTKHVDDVMNKLSGKYDKNDFMYSPDSRVYLNFNPSVVLHPDTPKDKIHEVLDGKHTWNDAFEDYHQYEDESLDDLFDYHMSLAISKHKNFDASHLKKLQNHKNPEISDYFKNEKI